MQTLRAASRSQKLALCLMVGVLLMFSSGCLYATNLIGSLPSNSKQNTMPASSQPDTQKSADPTEQPLIPQTGADSSNLTACPGTNLTKMLAYGKYLYEFQCATCHGRLGQGFPERGPFPPLIDTPLAVSDDIQSSLYMMMNTDLHPMAPRLFEADALAVINYIRITLAKNIHLICPGEYEIKINP